MNQLRKINKRGQTLNVISGTVIGFMILIFLIFAVLFGISALNPSSFFTAGSTEANATIDLTQNLTSGVSQFGGYIPSVMKVLAVVLILAAIVLLVFYVNRMRDTAGTGTGGL